MQMWNLPNSSLEHVVNRWLFLNEGGFLEELSLEDGVDISA
jgi:hypothetical protein